MACGLTDRGCWNFPSLLSRNPSFVYPRKKKSKKSPTFGSSLLALDRGSFVQARTSHIALELQVR